jgi:TPR repeat protein
MLRFSSFFIAFLCFSSLPFLLSAAEKTIATPPAPSSSTFAFTVPPTAEVLLQRAKQGDARAAFVLAKRYLHGLPRLAPDYEAAAHWLKRATQQNNPDAAILLASLYQSQKLTPPSATYAQELFQFGYQKLETAAKAGDADAMAKIGTLYAKGVMVKKDTKTALQWFEQAIAKGSLRAKYTLGGLTIWGNTAAYPEEKARLLLQDAADAGNSRAWVKLGLSYSGAFGGSVNAEHAAFCFGQALKLGSSEGARQLGIATLSGYGVAKNIPEGLRLITQAAEQGKNPDAMYHLAMAAHLGATSSGANGTAKNNALYTKWLQAAGDYDHPDSDYLLGEAYLQGEGVPANRETAIFYLKAARNKANVAATHKLADMAAAEAGEAGQH